jgi:hypothetical protein
MTKKKPNKQNIIQPNKRTGGGSVGIGSLTNFTNANDIENRF